MTTEAILRKRAYCQAYYQKNKARIQAYNLAHRREKTVLQYGLSIQEWNSLFENQGRRCANSACLSDVPGGRGYWSTDHCHTTGKVRGILCHHCNLVLGHVKDSVEKLNGLTEYLRRSV